MSEATTTTPAAAAKPKKQQELPQRIWPADNAQYLLEAGWRPTGHPEDPGTRWLDPTKPERDEERIVEVGKVTHENGQVEVIKQVHVTPRVQAVSLHEAVHEQLVRDGRVPTR